MFAFVQRVAKPFMRSSERTPTTIAGTPFSLAPFRESEIHRCCTKTMSLACNCVKYLSGTSWIGRTMSSKFSEFSSNYHFRRIALDTGNLAVDPCISPIHRDRLGHVVPWDPGADPY
jgi:hypothetical protein